MVDAIQRTVIRSSRLAAILILMAEVAVAAPITVPTGLNPGDQYRLAFLTGSATTAQSTNIADYNAFVTTVANTQPALAALATTWTVIGSTSSVDARDNSNTNPVNTGLPIYLLDGTSKIADNNADLWDGTIDNFLNVNESGNVVGQLNVWTGTASNGTKSVAVNAKELGNSPVASGNDAAISAQWIFSSGHDNFDPEPVYAISGVLTVPAPLHRANAPILSVTGMLGLASLLLWFGAWTAQRRSRKQLVARAL